MGTSLYIHIPFCRRKCLYCDFASTVYDAGSANFYIESIKPLIEAIETPVCSIYIGGGTPIILEKETLSSLCRSLKRFLRDGVEFTVEANPESLNTDKLITLRDGGVNRLSIGIQSLNNKKLKMLGRLHDSSIARKAIVLADKSGFENLSADLIFGVWNENPEEWRADLDDITALPLKHISAYSLTYEKSTPLFQALKNGSLHALEDSIVASMYETAIDILSLRGFKQYEISNFAQAGHPCRHNIGYWDNDPYIGIGPSAVSYLDGVRSRNAPDFKDYMKRSVEGKILTDFREKLTDLKRAKETAALKIRTKGGIDFEWFKLKTGYDFMRIEKRSIGRLIESDLIKYVKSGDKVAGICLKRKGFLFCDTVSSALL